MKNIVYLKLVSFQISDNVLWPQKQNYTFLGTKRDTVTYLHIFFKNV